MGAPDEGQPLDRALCRVGGLNQNFATSCGTPCHVQVEDYGPVVDRASEQEVRRLNVIVYAGYGTPSARIVFGRDFDYPDVRSHEYNRTIKEQMSELAAQAQAETEQAEQRELTCMRAWFTGRDGGDETALREEFREFAELYPAVFKRALAELRAGKRPAPARTNAPSPAPSASAEPPPPAPPPPVAPADVTYPLDAERRRRVIEIEGLILKLTDDIENLKQQGRAHDLLLQRSRKVIEKAHETLRQRHTGDVDLRLLDITLDNLAKTWRQVRTLLVW